MTGFIEERAALEHLAEAVEARAARAREHATMARELAIVDAALGQHAAHELHRREADAHERAAVLSESTAALYRRRATHLAESDQ